MINFNRRFDDIVIRLTISINIGPDNIEMSLLNLFNILPVGVLSKKLVWALTIEPNSFSCDLIESFLIQKNIIILDVKINKMLPSPIKIKG